MRFRIFPDGVYVTAVAQGHDRAIGARVVRIGNTPVESALERLQSIQPFESEPWKRVKLAALLPRAEVLCVVGVIDSGTSLPLQIVPWGETGGSERIVIEAMGDDTPLVGWFSAEDRDAPRWLTRRDESYWAEENDGTLYVAYNRCVDDRNRPFDEFLRDVVELAETTRPERFVIDLRHNSGGASMVLHPLMEWLACHPTLNDPDRLFVLIGPRTYSSGMMNAYELRDRTRATLVGEPTGGKPNGYGEIRILELPRSRMLLHCSTKYFQAVEADPPSVTPDVTVVLTAAAYFGGRDVVLERVLREAP